MTVQVFRFQLGEVLLLLAGCLTLAALAAPLVLSAREDARAVTCESHLQLTGRSCLAYARAHNQTLPANRRRPFTGWNIQVLPYVDRQKIYDQYDFSKDWWAAANRKAGETHIAAFTCPATPRQRREVQLLDPSGDPFHGAATDYVASAGAYLFRNKAEQLYRGAMASPGRHYGGSRVTAGHAVRLTDITDGLSNSLLIVEMAGKPDQWRAGKLITDRSREKNGRPLVPVISFGNWSAPVWNHLRSYDATGAKAFGPCAVNCSNGGSIYGFHRGFANASFADGSVKRLRRGLDEEVMVALVSIADGELITSGDYAAGTGRNDTPNQQVTAP